MKVWKIRFQADELGDGAETEKKPGWLEQGGQSRERNQVRPSRWAGAESPVGGHRKSLNFILIGIGNRSGWESYATKKKKKIPAN